jgi:hypothetical protein
MAEKKKKEDELAKLQIEIAQVGFTKFLTTKTKGSKLKHLLY